MVPRQYKRINHNVPAMLRLTFGVNYFSVQPGHLTDISISGLRVVLENAALSHVNPGSRATVSIEREGEAPRLDVAGWVLRTEGDLDQHPEFVICFDRLHYDIVAALHSHRNVTIDMNQLARSAHRCNCGGKTEV